MCQFVVCFLVTTGGKTNPSRTTPSAKATPTSKEAGKGISLTVPRYDLDEAITQISKRYGVQVISQPYAKPRVNIALLNAKKRPMVFRNQSLEQVFNTLARLFQYDWFKEGSIYVFKNRLAAEDTLYFVDEKTRQLAEANHNNGTFRFLSQFVNLTQQQVMSLAEQHPQFSLLYSISSSRAQIEAYQTLPNNLRARLDAGKKIYWNEIPESAGKALTKVILARYSKATSKEFASTIFWLARDKQGWEQLMFSGSFASPASQSPRLSLSKRKRQSSPSQ